MSCRAPSSARVSSVLPRHCAWDHEPPATFDELDAVGPPNCTAIVVDSRPGGFNWKGSVDFWRREKPVFGVVAARYAAANE